MVYTVYKTTNLLNGRYYFGVHKTENPNDDYLGSGVYIKRALEKHGRKELRKDVLFVYDETNRGAAFAKEDELIQCFRGKDSLCMNLRKGGEGGFDFINRNGLQKEAAKKQGLIQGHRNVESGFIQRLGLDAGRKAVESGRLASYRTKEHQARAGKIQGIQNAQNGHLAGLRTPELMKKAQRAAGRKAVESGQLARIRGKGIAASHHSRWHVKRNLISPSCPLCQTS